MLLCPLQVSLNHGQLAGNLVVFPVGLLSQEARLLQLVLEGLHPLLVGEGSVLQHLPHTLGLICGMAGLGELLGGGGEPLLAPLEVLLQQLDPPVQGGNLTLGLLAPANLHLELPRHVLALLLVLLHLLLRLPHLLLEDIEEVVSLHLCHPGCCCWCGRQCTPPCTS